MSEKFTVPEGVINRINEIFPNSEERRKIAYTLMFWNKNPIGSERQEIGEKVGRERNTVNIVVRRLSEEGLMTEEFGSVPLFRYMKNMRLSLEIPQDTVPITPDKPLEHPEDSSDLSEPPEEEVVEHDLQEVDKPPTSVDMPISKELEKWVALTEANIKGLETTIDTRFNARGFLSF